MSADHQAPQSSKLQEYVLTWAASIGRVLGEVRALKLPAYFLLDARLNFVELLQVGLDVFPFVVCLPDYDQW